VNVHKPIRYTHGYYYYDVHQKRHNDDALVEPDQAIVLLEAMLEEVRIYYPDEVVVQERIEEQIDYFLNTIPDCIDLYPPNTIKRAATAVLWG
jgi:hypothetical protein